MIQFKIGNKVRWQRPFPGCAGTCVGEHFATSGIINEIDNDQICVVYNKEQEAVWFSTMGRCANCISLSSEQNQPKEVVMNETIAKTYEKTSDAMLVNKWFGGSITTTFDHALLRINAKAILIEAKLLEDEQLAKAK